MGIRWSKNHRWRVSLVRYPDCRRLREHAPSISFWLTAWSSNLDTGDHCWQIVSFYIFSVWCSLVAWREWESTVPENREPWIKLYCNYYTVISWSSALGHSRKDCAFHLSTEGTKQTGLQYVNNFSSSATHSGQKRFIATIRPLILKGLLKTTMVSIGYLEANE